MAEFCEPFSFLFWIVLSLFLSPKEQGTVYIDCISTQTGQVQSMFAEKTKGGYMVYSEKNGKKSKKISIQQKKGSDLIFYVIDNAGENESVNLTEIAKQIKPLKEIPRQSLSFPNDNIQLVLSDNVLYIYLQRDQKMLVIH